MPKRIAAITMEMGKGDIHLHDMYYLLGKEVQVT
jgi:hypothetical protein